MGTLLLAAAGGGGCSLASWGVGPLCDEPGDCAALETCGSDFRCVPVELALAEDAGFGAPVPVDDDNPEAPRADAGPANGPPVAFDDGRPPGGDAGRIVPSPPTDAGTDDDGRPYGATPGGDPLPPPEPAADAGTDENGRCIRDFACSAGEVCQTGVCEPA